MFLHIDALPASRPYHALLAYYCVLKTRVLVVQDKITNILGLHPAQFLVLLPL